MSKNIMKYMIKETKYDLTGMDMPTRVLFIIGCIVVSGYFFIHRGILDEGDINLTYVFISMTAGFANGQYNFGRDAYRMLPFSREEYQWILILEGVPLQFIMSAVAALFTFPAIVMQRDLNIMVKCFVCMLSVGLWLRHIGWINRFFGFFPITKHSKRWSYIIMDWIISFLYIGVFIFNIVTERNVYLSALLSLLFIFIILAVAGIIRKHWLNKLLSTY